MLKDKTWLHKRLGIIVLGFMVLGQAGNAAAQPYDLIQLINKLKQEQRQNPKEAIKLANDLPKCAPPANPREIQALMDLIGASQGDIQQKAIDCMAKINDPKLGLLFIPYINHKNPMIQATAAGICGKLKVRGSVPLLMEIVRRAAPVEGFADTPAERAAVTAVVALGEIGNDRSIPALTDRLGRMGGYETNALAKFGHRAVPQLFKLAAEGKDKEIRQGAAQTLTMINDPQAVPLFRDEIKNKTSPVRKYAMIALLNSDPDKGLRELMTLWQDDRQDSMLEYQLMFHINNNRLKDQSLCPFLIHVLEHSPDKNSRKGAATALGRIGGDESIAALKKALNDEDEQVKLYAGQSLEMLTGKPAGK